MRATATVETSLREAKGKRVDKSRTKARRKARGRLAGCDLGRGVLEESELTVQKISLLRLILAHPKLPRSPARA